MYDNNNGYPGMGGGNGYGIYGYTPNNSQPGKEAAIASLVLGIVSLICIFLYKYTVVHAIGLICGILGAIFAASAKRVGNTSGIATAGLICSIIGAVINGLMFAACVACESFFYAVFSSY